MTNDLYVFVSCHCNLTTDLQLRTQNICVFSSCDQQQQQHTKAPRTSFNGDYYSPSHSEATTMMVRIHREEQFISEGDKRTPQKFLSLLMLVRSPIVIFTLIPSYPCHSKRIVSDQKSIPGRCCR